MAENPIQEVAGQIGSKLVGSILWFGLALLGILVVGFVMYYFVVYKRKFNIRVKILSQRAGDRNKVLWDKGAILLDKKSREPYFRIFGMKIDLPVPDFDFLQTTSEGNSSIDYVEVYRKSENEIGFLRPPRIDKERVIKSNGKIYLVAGQGQIPLDLEDGYWRALRNEMNKSMFSKDKLFMKLIEFAPQIIGGVILLFILWIFMDKLPPILSNLDQVAKSLAQAQKADVITGLSPLLFLKWNKKQ